MAADGVNCRLQVAGRRSQVAGGRLQVAGCRLQVRISLKCERSWIAFCFLVSHLRDSAKKKRKLRFQFTHSIHNVFRCILATNETITRFLLNYIATYTSLSIDRAKAHGSAGKTSHNILETQQSSGRGG